MKVCLMMRLSTTTTILFFSGFFGWFAGGGAPSLPGLSSSTKDGPLLPTAANSTHTFNKLLINGKPGGVERNSKNSVGSPGTSNFTSIGWNNSFSIRKSRSSSSGSNSIKGFHKELWVNPDVRKRSRKRGPSNQPGSTGISPYSSQESPHRVPTIFLDKEYTSQDIAEYIFWTGDERGVTMAINDLFNDGLMSSRDDVIKFLEDVKSDLEYIRSRYDTFHISRQHLNRQTEQGKFPFGRGGREVDRKKKRHLNLFSEVGSVSSIPSSFYFLIPGIF